LKEWQEKPFAPWSFREHVLLSVFTFFESNIVADDFSLKKELRCEIFMDSGAFVATTMDLRLDPYEVAEIQAILKADLIVPLDEVVLLSDSKDIANEKVNNTIRNTEILLDLKPKGSEIVGPLQGFSEELLQKSFDKFFELGIRKFALGGLVFDPDLKSNLEKIKIAKKVTKNHYLHIFGKFLHPELLNHIIELDVSSVDGYGYIISSIKGLYIINNKYESLTNLEEEDIKKCNCVSCQKNNYQDLIRGDREAQLLTLQHNIWALNELKEQIIKQKKKS
jgi:tRNA-guanine family transglycosylase